MDKNDIKTFVIGAISGALGAFVLANSGLTPVSQTSIETALSNVSFTLPAGIAGPQGPPGPVLLTQNFNTQLQSNSNQPALIGPLIQASPYYIFDSTLMGPEYGTKRETNQNIIMGYHLNDEENTNFNRISIGNNSGNTVQIFETIAIGKNAGETNQNQNAIAIGSDAGAKYQENFAVAIGQLAGNSMQKSSAIAIGKEAGSDTQGMFSIAIGQKAGKTKQKINCIAIGSSAGEIEQAESSVAIGYVSGATYQGESCVAIGTGAGSNYQGKYSVAIGSGAGRTNQVSRSICLGYESSIQDIDEIRSKNKITMCLGVRESIDNDDGGADSTNSFIYSNSDSIIPTNSVIDGYSIDTPNTAGYLAEAYFNNRRAVGFLNIKVNRGARKFVGFLPLLNLKEILDPTLIT